MTGRSCPTLAHRRIGLVHTTIGGSDGVSIVIEQLVEALHHYAAVPLEGFYFACGEGYSAPGRQLWQDTSLWHKDSAIDEALAHFETEPPPAYLKQLIEARAHQAHCFLQRFVQETQVDLLLAHNSSHPVNLIASLALSRLVAQRRSSGQCHPEYMVWWHDSHLERERFFRPSSLLRDYLLEGVPGPLVDGIVFINSQQWSAARSYFARLTDRDPHLLQRLAACHEIIPNTCEVPEQWIDRPERRTGSCAPRLDPYNEDFLEVLGINRQLRHFNTTLGQAVLVLQHTRIVFRKRIDQAIDFCYALARRFQTAGQPRLVFLLISGPSGDELTDEVGRLTRHGQRRQAEHPDLRVEILWGKEHISSRREVIQGVKRYAFAEIPAIVAYYGGLGTYFSEVEGFGNNLLELISLGVPTVVREYPVFQSDLAPYGFHLPSTTDESIPDDLVDQALQLLTDAAHRRAVVTQNIRLLQQYLGHQQLARGFFRLWDRMQRAREADGS